MKLGLDIDAIGRISDVLVAIDSDFPSQDFIKDALTGLDDLELKQRVDHLIAILAKYLPTDFAQAAAILLQVKQYWDWGDDNDALSSFAAWPLTDYVAVYGINQPEIALTVLPEVTALFTAEFAIRPFIEQHFDLTYRQLLVWSQNDDEHIRRLASEGIRPRLPWGKRLSQLCDDPDVIFPLLDQLKDDTSLYVRKSVANNLNDIAKDHPNKVIEKCQQWMIDAPVERQWLIRHALRGLIKAGNAKVFPLLGYTQVPQLKVMGFDLAETSITLGQSLALSLTLLSQSSEVQTLVVDYKIHHVKANGTTSGKVFKWKNITLLPQQSLSLEKQHSFKKIRTRKYYSGVHGIELLINGVPRFQAEFHLMMED
ncbi:MAG: DNA alkylation repair protein [Methylophagaceae bacterium]